MKRTIIQYIELKEWIKIYFARRKIKVASIEETIEKIVRDQSSVSRFGDGEFYLMDGRSIGFQDADIELSKRLVEVVESTNSNHLVCIGSGINPVNYDIFSKENLKWTTNHYRFEAANILKYLDSSRKYYNTLISRFWIPLRDKNRARKIASRLKEIWRGRDVVIVEGKETRMGVGNDLFADVKSCRRILCPASNAYNKYSEILYTAKTFPKDSLFLIALGPTATVLAYDLYKEGYQAIDIGHIDLEYEWMNAGASEIIKINNKYVNEIDGGDIVDRCEDKNYIAEIIKVID